MFRLALLAVLALLEPDVADRPSVLVVVGAQGTEEYGKQFRDWANRWRRAAQAASASFNAIGLEEGSDDHEALRRAIEQERSSSGPLWLILIGHGTFDGKTARFNLRGPDVTAGELAEWFTGFKRPLAIINCAAASGPFINELSAPDRVIVTAAKSGFEHNFARFGDFLSAAVVDSAADLNKDDQTSLLEAFLLAAARAQELYASEGRLATEHALLDDNGDRLGTPADWFRGLRATKAARDGATLDGTLAAQFLLVASDHERRLSTPARRRRDELESAFSRLRQRKQALSEDDYYAELEPLLVEMAQLYGEQ